MTDRDKSRPQASTGGPLDIRDENITPIGGDAALKGKTAPANRQSQPQDLNAIGEKIDDQHQKIRKEVDEATDLPQKGSA